MVGEVGMSVVADAVSDISNLSMGVKVGSSLHAWRGRFGIGCDKASHMLITSIRWPPSQIDNGWCNPLVSSRKGGERNEADRLRTTITPQEVPTTGPFSNMAGAPGESTLGRRCSANNPPGPSHS